MVITMVISKYGFEFCHNNSNLFIQRGDQSNRLVLLLVLCVCFFPSELHGDESLIISYQWSSKLVNS